MKIKIYTVGGTIDKVYFDRKSEYEVGDPKIGAVLKEAHVNFEYSVEAITGSASLLYYGYGDGGGTEAASITISEIAE